MYKSLRTQALKFSELHVLNQKVLQPYSVSPERDIFFSLGNIFQLDKFTLFIIVIFIYPILLKSRLLAYF